MVSIPLPVPSGKLLFWCNVCLAEMDAGQIVRFNVSGGIGTAIFFGVYTIILQYFPDRQALVWTLSYLLSIIWQHALHRFLVFGSDKPYFKVWPGLEATNQQSLLGTYLAYSVGIVISHFLMEGLQALETNPTVSWVIGLAFTGLINYFMVREAFK
jgi:putative flippase GtrA